MATTSQMIAANYIAFYNRAADASGKTFWTNAATSSSLSGLDLMKSMATGFAAHPSFAATYGSMDDTAFVNAIYMNVGGAAADANGLTYWVGQLTAGKSRAHVVAEFTYGLLETTRESLDAQLASGTITAAEHANAILRQDRMINKSTVADTFTSKLGTASNLAATTNANDAASLAADPAYQASVNILKGVNQDEASMTEEMALLNGASPTVAAINTAFANAGTFTLTSSATPDILTLTSSNDTVVGAAGTLQTGDVIVDSSTADADVMNVSVNAYVAGTVPTITNVETINVAGAFAATGLAFTNITGTKTVNLTGAISGTTATVDGVTSAKAATINAGTNVGSLNVNTTAAFTVGTGGAVTINAGSATTLNVGNAGNTGNDTYVINPAAASTITLNGGGGTDTATLNLVGGATTLNNGAASDINILNINSNTSANTVTLANANSLTGFASADGITVGGTQALTIVGNGDAISGNDRTSSTVGAALTKAAGAGTVTFTSNAGLTNGFFNRALIDVLNVTTATGTNVTVNEATTLKLAVANGTQTYDVDNNTATTLANGAGVLKVDLAGSSAANAIQTSMTTGLRVGTTLITNNTIDSTITTLDTNGTAATVDTVVASGSKNLTVGTWTATANEVFTADSLTGNLTMTVGANAATVIGGTGNDTITGGSAADNLRGGAGNDSIAGGALADTITSGTGNDRIKLTTTATDVITDFSISGINATDVIEFSAATFALVYDGDAAPAVGGSLAKTTLVTGAKTTVAGDNIFVLSGTFANAAAVEAAIETGGSRVLTAGAGTAAIAEATNDILLIVWSDGTNSHISTYDAAATAAGAVISGAMANELVTLTGVTSVDALTGSNFAFVV